MLPYKIGNANWIDYNCWSASVISSEIKVMDFVCQSAVSAHSIIKQIEGRK